MHILVIEDDSQVADILAEALRNRHYRVDVTNDGETAWAWVGALTYDLVLLDIMLPGLDGVNWCRLLRSRNALLPVLMLTARDTVEDRILGLDAGADDYLVKPFDLQELMARVRALLRRGQAATATELVWGSLCLNASTCEVRYNEQPVSLTRKETALLALLLRGGRRVQGRASIIQQLWSHGDTPTEETVKSHLKGLRQKLRGVGAPEDLIETVHGLGYRLKQL